jgi:hypothetical protein
MTCLDALRIRRRFVTLRPSGRRRDGMAQRCTWLENLSQGAVARGSAISELIIAGRGIGSFNENRQLAEAFRGNGSIIRLVVRLHTP